ncbi:MAG: hypothetical protein EBV03_05135 [Proteobacteria bacterium]|nr:hypothetical protein [Pseudomonadota bacterium]
MSELFQQLQTQSKIADLIAVTSLNVKNGIARQRAALSTWKQFGLVTHAVQFDDECDAVWAAFGDLVDVIHFTPNIGYKSPGINRLVDVSKLLDVSIMLINSDIEIIGARNQLFDQVDESKLTVGIRHNYKTTPQSHSREVWGLDIFVVSPQIAAMVDEITEFCIGRPMWDYWFPWHLSQKGVELNWIAEPFFFHRLHALNWSQKDWRAGRDVFLNRYNLAEPNWVNFRQQWPYGSQKYRKTYAVKERNTKHATRKPTKDSALKVLAPLNIKTVIDVGVADCTEELMLAFPSARHHLIEPDAKWLSTYAETYKNIDHVAYCFKADSTDNRIDDRIKNVQADILLKIDVDGPEADVITGCKNIMPLVAAVVVEVTPSNFSNVVACLASYEFDLFDIVDMHYCGDSWHQCDMIFVRNDFVAEVRTPWDINLFYAATTCP